MNILKSAIILNKISDHLPCLAVISVKKNKRKIPKYVDIQNNSEEAISNFKSELTSKLSNTVFEQNILTNPNINYNKLNDILIQCKLNNMPTKRVRFKGTWYFSLFWNVLDSFGHLELTHGPEIQTECIKPF